MAFLDPVFNPVLQPLLNASPFLGILILSFVVSLLITLSYKFLTNQKEMKRIKDEQKEGQKKLKELKSNPAEMMEIQKDLMKKNMDYMKHSLRATLITMIPLLLIFGWMSSHLTYEPIYPGETYSVSANFLEGVSGQAELKADEGTDIINSPSQPINGAATWNLKSEEGEHFLTVKTGETEQTKKVLITTDLAYENPITSFEHSDIQNIQVNQNKLKPAGKFSLFGWQPGWLGWYIIFSIAFSIGLRKVLKIY